MGKFASLIEAKVVHLDDHRNTVTKGTRRATIHDDGEGGFTVKKHLNGKYLGHDHEAVDRDEAEAHAHHWVHNQTGSSPHINFDESFTLGTQKKTWRITVTRKGEDKPTTYDAESHGSKIHYAKHAREGDTVHKIEDTTNGKDVTADTKRRYDKSLHQGVDEATDQLDELSNEKIQTYKVAAKADKYEKANAARKGDKGAAADADKRQEGIDKANKRLATKAEGTEMGKFATLLGKEQVVEDQVNEDQVDEAGSTYGTSTPMRKKGSYESGERKATVHRDVDWNEYRVKHHINGVHQKEADYHTDDKEEAHDWAKRWVGQGQKNESLEPIEELSNDTLKRYVVKAAIKNSAIGLQRGFKAGSDTSHIGSDADKKDIKKQQNTVKGITKAVRKLTKEQTEMIQSFNEKADEFTPHASRHTGVVYHTNPTHTNQLGALKHGDAKVIEAVHHDGYQLHVRKYEAHRVRNTIHLHDRQGNHVDSFPL